MPANNLLQALGHQLRAWWQDKRLTALAAALVAFILPLNQKAAVWALGVLGLLTLIHFRERRPKNMASFAVMVVLYGLYAAGVLYTDHPLAGHHPNTLEQKLSLIIFPVLALFIRPMTASERRAIVAVFATGVTVFAVVAFAAAGLRFLESGEHGEFVYTRLVLTYHPTYMAIYACLALAFVLETIWFRQRGHWSWLLWAAGLVSFVAFISSKAGLLSTGILVVLLLFTHSIRSRSFGRAWMHAALLVGILFALPRFVPGAESRVAEFTEAIERQVDEQERNKSMARTSTQVRFLAWQCSLELMIEHPFGVGSDDATPSLMEKYEEREEDFAYLKKLNAHNQYLETGVELGWAGLAVLLLMLALGLRQALLHRDILFQSLLFLAGFNMLFESFLELQSGIVFLLFFWMVLANREKADVTPPPLAAGGHALL